MTHDANSAALPCEPVLAATQHIVESAPATPAVDAVESAPAAVATVRRSRPGKAVLDLVLLIGVICAALAFSPYRETGPWIIAAVAATGLALKLITHSGRVLAGLCPLCQAPNRVSRAAHVFCCTGCQHELFRVRLPDAAGNQRTWFKPWRLGT